MTKLEVHHVTMMLFQDKLILPVQRVLPYELLSNRSVAFDLCLYEAMFERFYLSKTKWFYGHQEKNNHQKLMLHQQILLIHTNDVVMKIPS